MKESPLCTPAQCSKISDEILLIKAALWGVNNDNGINGDMKAMRAEMKDGFSSIAKELKEMRVEQTEKWEKQVDINWKQRLVTAILVLSGGGAGGAFTTIVMRLIS